MNSELRSLWIVIRQQLRSMRTGSIWWAIGICIYTVVNLLVYPTFRDSGMMKSIPPTMVKAFGLEDMLKVGAFLFSKVYATLPLVFAFYPIMTFSGAIAGAEERSSLDILMSQPIKRRVVVLATWIAMAIMLLLILLVTGVVAWGTIQVIGEHLSLGTTLQSTLLVYPVVMAIGSIALALSARMRNRSAVIGISVGLMFLMYLIDVVGKLKPSLDNLRWASVFRFFGDVTTQDVPWWHPLVLLAIAVTLLLLAIPLFDRRDIFT